MYNVQKMVETGRRAIQRNPRRDASASDFQRIREGNPDNIAQMCESYFLGVAVGLKIAEAERTATQE